MTKRNLIIFMLLISLGMTANLQAQDNVGKVHLSSLVSKRIDLGYERVIYDNQSVAINLGYMLPRNIPLIGMAESLFSPENEFNINTTTDGVKLVGEYRFYTKADRRNRAPRGFYVGPYIYCSNYRGAVEVGLSDHYLSVEGNMFTLGAGAQIGVQWLISDMFSIDFTILGLGLGYSSVKGDLTSSDVSEVYESLVDDINEAMEDLPVGDGSILQLGVYGDGIHSGFRTGLPNLRMMLSVGVAF